MDLSIQLHYYAKIQTNLHEVIESTMASCKLSQNDLVQPKGLCIQSQFDGILLLTSSWRSCLDDLLPEKFTISASVSLACWTILFHPFMAINVLPVYFQSNRWGEVKERLTKVDWLSVPSQTRPCMKHQILCGVFSLSVSHQNTQSLMHEHFRILNFCYSYFSVSHKCS